MFGAGRILRRSRPRSETVSGTSSGREEGAACLHPRDGTRLGREVLRDPLPAFPAGGAGGAPEPAQQGPGYREQGCSVESESPRGTRVAAGEEAVDEAEGERKISKGVHDAPPGQEASQAAAGCREDQRDHGEPT